MVGELERYRNKLIEYIESERKVCDETQSTFSLEEVDDVLCNILDQVYVLYEKRDQE